MKLGRFRGADRLSVQHVGKKVRRKSFPAPFLPKVCVLDAVGGTLISTNCLAVFAVRGESTRAGSLFSLWVTCRCLRNTLQKVPKVDATQLGTIVYRSA